MSFDKNMFLGWVQNKLDTDQAHKEARNSSYLEQQKIQGDMYNALHREPAPSLFDSIARVTDNEGEKKNLSDNVELSEDVEQVDELKKSTIMNYKDKAKAQRNDIARRNQSVKGPLIGKDADQMIKRGKGVDKATKKLVAREYEKEGVDEEMSPKDISNPMDRVKMLRRLALKKQLKSIKADKVAKAQSKVTSKSEEVDEGLLGTIGKVAAAGGAAYAAHKLSNPENRKKVGDAVKNVASKLVTPERKEKIKSGLKSVARDVAATAAEKLKQRAADKVSEYGSKPAEKKDKVEPGKLRMAQ